MPKRLHRSRTERWVAGVCGGLSDYFNVDVMALRVGFALLTLWNGFGLVLYAPRRPDPRRTADRGGNRTRAAAASRRRGAPTPGPGAGLHPRAGRGVPAHPADPAL